MFNFDGIIHSVVLIGKYTPKTLIKDCRKIAENLRKIAIDIHLLLDTVINKRDNRINLKKGKERIFSRTELI